MFALGVTLGIFFGGKSLPQPQETLTTRETRQAAKYNLDHETKPMIVEAPDLRDHPRLQQIIRSCTIPRLDMRTRNCQALLSQIQNWAEDEGIRIKGLNA